MNAMVLPALLFVCGADDKVPEPKLPLGRDTTYVTGPLDKHGYIDYEVALNAALSKGVTADNNVNALLILALGPAPEGGDPMPPEYFKWLDVPEPPKTGDYFQGAERYVRGQLGLIGPRLEAFYEFQGRATSRPWAPKDCPPMVEWIKVNEKPLALVIEAVKRPKYFCPMVSRRKDGEPSNLIGVLLPTIQKCREVTAVLAARAMLNLNEGKYDDAWRDIITCHRLGRHLTHGATLIEALVGIAVCQIASNATLAYLDRADLTSEKLLERLKELRALPPVGLLADKIDLSERMMGLDALQGIRRGGGGVDFPGLPPVVGDPKERATFDWAPTMRSLNGYYDRSAKALRLKDRAAREKELDRLEKDLAAAAKLVPGDGALALVGGADAAKVGKHLGDTLVALLSPAIRKVQGAHDRIAQVEQNLHVAFAVAAYKQDNGRFPAKLAALTPKYLADVPGDLFSGKELIYKPTEKGYLFYSVGQNGKDEGGRWYDDDPPGDDPRVRMPLPEPKKN